jgi:hypothetical protein
MSHGWAPVLESAGKARNQQRSQLLLFSFIILETHPGAIEHREGVNSGE